jgi:RNA-binding protein Nova
LYIRHAAKHELASSLLPLQHTQVKMAVSRKLCGAVIGQKGQTIRDFMADSGATIRVQPLSELTPSDSERLITVSGGRDKVLRAVALILNTVRAAQL